MSKRTATSEGGTSAKKQCLDRSGPATLYSTWSVDDVVDFLENNDDFKEVAGKFEGTKFAYNHVPEAYSTICLDQPLYDAQTHY